MEGKDFAVDEEVNKFANDHDGMCWEGKACLWIKTDAIAVPVGADGFIDSKLTVNTTESTRLN